MTLCHTVVVLVLSNEVPAENGDLRKMYKLQIIFREIHQ